MEYIVRQYEVWTHEYRVQADSPKDALHKVWDGVDEPEVHELEFEYSYIMDGRDEVMNCPYDGVVMDIEDLQP